MEAERSPDYHRSKGAASRRLWRGNDEIPERRPDPRAAAGRDLVVPVAGADPDRLQRRIPAVPADAAAARSRGAAEGFERRAGQEAGPVAAALLPDRGRDGGLLRRDEPGVRADLRGQRGGGGDAGTGQPAGAGEIGPD